MSIFTRLLPRLYLFGEADALQPLNQLVHRLRLVSGKPKIQYDF